MRNYLISNYDLMNGFINEIFSNEQNATLMRTDVIKEENGFKLEIEVPGVKKEDINISYEKEYLTVSAERKVEKEESEKYVRTERSRLYKRSYLARGIDKDKISAKYADGILTLFLPLKEEDYSKKIIVE